MTHCMTLPVTQLITLQGLVVGQNNGLQAGRPEGQAGYWPLDWVTVSGLLYDNLNYQGFDNEGSELECLDGV